MVMLEVGSCTPLWLQCSALVYRMKQCIWDTLDDGGSCLLCSAFKQVSGHSWSQACGRQYQVVIAAAAAASDLNQSKLAAELDGQGASWPGAVGGRRPVR